MTQQARKRSRPWSIQEFRQLLADYLTEPDFADVRFVGENRLTVNLPDGGGQFRVEIRVPAK